jgi:type IV pilus assembly protein PilC
VEFYYRAITREGERVTGHHKARTTAAARRELAGMFASVLEVSEVDTKALAKKNKPFKVKQEAVSIFFRRMATMLNSGVPLADALHFMITSEADPTLSRAVEYLTKSVLGGSTLSGAMRDPKMKLMFDPVCCGMIQLGEQTGQLSKIMGKLADLKERQLALTRSMISALTYPAVLACVIVIIGLLFTMILGPGENGLFSAFGTEIPWPTRVVQTVSSYVRRPWLILPFVLLAGVGALAFRHAYKTNQPFRLWVDIKLCQIPIVGPLIHKIECARILYVLSDGLEVGLPAIHVLAMARDVCSNEKVKVELIGVLRRFSDGSELTECLSQYQLFPRMVVSMVEVGMESGKLDKVLGQACIGYEEEVQMALDNVARLAEPLLLAFAGFMAGFLAIATLLPIIKLTQTL